MSALPVATPFTMPVADPTVATEVADELQEPPDGLLARVVLPPTHIAAIPVMVEGLAFIVMVTVLWHPPGIM